MKSRPVVLEGVSVLRTETDQSFSLAGRQASSVVSYQDPSHASRGSSS